MTFKGKSPDHFSGNPYQRLNFLSKFTEFIDYEINLCKVRYYSPKEQDRSKNLMRTNSIDQRPDEIIKFLSLYQETYKKEANINVPKWVISECLHLLTKSDYKPLKLSKYEKKYRSTLLHMDRYLEVIRIHSEETTWDMVYQEASERLEGYDSFASKEALRKSYKTVSKLASKKEVEFYINPMVDIRDMELKNITQADNMSVHIHGTQTRANKYLGEKLAKKHNPHYQ